TGVVRGYQGWNYYPLHCARCNGEDVNGTTIAPHLILSLKPGGAIPDAPTFLQTVCAGRPEKGMPAWCALELLPGQIDTIYAYVKGRSDGVLHPGRPARRAEGNAGGYTPSRTPPGADHHSYPTHPMTDIKTKPTKASVTAFIRALPDPEQRREAKTLLAMFRRVTGEPAKMWGPTIIGFGSYHYR